MKFLHFALWSSCLLCSQACQDGRLNRVKRFPFEVESFGSPYGFIPDAATLYGSVVDALREEHDVHGESAVRYTKQTKGDFVDASLSAPNRKVELKNLPDAQLQLVRAEFSQLGLRFTKLEGRLSELDLKLVKEANHRTTLTNDKVIVNESLTSLDALLAKPDKSTKIDFILKAGKLNGTIASLLCNIDRTCSSKGILEVIRDVEECHFDNVYGRTKDVFQLSRTALKVHAMYFALIGSTPDEVYIKNVNEKSAQIVRDLRRIEEECRNEDQVPTVMLQAMQGNRQKFHPFEGNFAREIHGALASRYSNKNWFVLVLHASEEGPKHVRKFSKGFHEVLNVTVDIGRVTSQNKSQTFQLSAYAISFSKAGDLSINKEIKEELKQVFKDYREIDHEFAKNRKKLADKMQEGFSTLESKYGHLARFVVVNNEVRSYPVVTYSEGVNPLCYDQLNIVYYCALPKPSGLPTSRLASFKSNQGVDVQPGIPLLRRVVAYTTYWGTKEFTVKQANYLTHVIFAYVEVLPGVSSEARFRVGGTTNIPDVDVEKDRLLGNRRLNELKTVKRLVNGRLKILVGVTGWKNSAFFALVASSELMRNNLISSLNNFLTEHEEIDGLDLDWGYPYNTVDKAYNAADCLKFLQQLRKVMNDLALRKNRPEPYILTIATPVTPSSLDTGYDWAKIADLVDWINVKTFDYYGDWNANEKDEQYTGPLAPLVSSAPKQFSTTRNVQYSIMDYYGKALPRYKSKIVLGVPFYGRHWTNVDPDDRAGGGRLKLDKDSSRSGIVGWRKIQSSWSNADGFEKRNFDSPSSGQYLWNTKEKTLLAFDGMDLLRTKLDYIMGNGLGGVAIWAIDMDTDFDMLLKAFSFKKSGEVDDTKILLTATAKTERPVGQSRLRLTQGDSFTFGYVEVTSQNGTTGYLGASNWNDKGAAVVCRQLGFGTGYSIPSSHYVTPKSKIKMFGIDNLACTGEEHDILHCPHDIQGSSSTEPSLAAVTCHSTNSFLSKISLSGGNFVSYGHVIVANGHSGQSGYICDNRWDDADATVVCRQLGFKSGRARRGSLFGTVPQGTFFAMDKVNCYGKERDILQCLHAGWRKHSCGRDQAAGVICQTVDSPLSDITLNGTNGVTYGQVLITEKGSGAFHYVGTDDWNDVNAAIVCRQLGFRYGSATSLSTLDSNIRDVLNEVTCAGSETDILQCIHRTWVSSFVGGVLCKPHGSLRSRVVLSGSSTCGNGFSSGNVLVSLGTINYGQVCITKWTDREADSVCKLLGFPGGQAMQCSGDNEVLGMKSTVFNTQCPENLTSVFDCTVSYADCPKENKVAVKCYERPGKLVTLKRVHNSRRYIFRNTARNDRILHAAATGNLTRVRGLINAGADVSQADSTDFGLTALHKAAEYGFLAIAETLIAASANVNARDNAGWTPLHWASLAGEREVAEVLIRSGADVDAQGVDGWTPLFHAAANGHPSLVEALLLGGATVDIRDNNGSTPLHWAAAAYGKFVEVNQNETEVLFNREGNHHLAAKALIKHGAVVDARDHQGWTPLHRAAMMYNKEEVADVLIKAGADINAQDDEGWTPLHWSSHRHRTKVACSLLKLGANKELRSYKTKKLASDVAFNTVWEEFC